MRHLSCIGLLTLAVLASQAARASTDHWIYDADVELFDDLDGDGYYRFLSVRVDADTLRDSAYVYCELYLSADGLNWERYHTTDDFWIGGETGDDEIYVETELVSGYPTGEYDLLIELYDADFGTFSDEFGPNQSDGMSLLPIEDRDHDRVQTHVIVSSGGGGGAFGLGLLPALLWLGWRSRRRVAA
jgi:hypothetical protein